MAAAGKRRNGDQRDARSIAEKVQRLDVAGVVVSAALIHGDEEYGGRKKFWVRCEMIHDFPVHALEEVELRRRRVTVQQTVGFYEGYGRQAAMLLRLE